MNNVVHVNELVTLTQINCGNCGGTYALNERYRLQRQEKGGGWNCPYCKCSWGYFGDTDVQRLEKQLEIEQRNLKFARENAAAERAAREQTERQLVARKAANTRLRNRVKNGICPCCSRSFMNLKQHMLTKHPEFQPEDKE